MTVKNRGGRWHYRFMYAGREYSATTGLDATKQNLREAERMQADHLRDLREGRTPQRKIVVRQFNDAAGSFLQWAKVEH